jgi:hypothetical protein
MGAWRDIGKWNSRVKLVIVALFAATGKASGTFFGAETGVFGSSRLKYHA